MKLLAMIIITIAAVFAPLVAFSTAGCTTQEAKAANDMAPAGACIASELLMGNDSPLAIVQACAGTTLADVAQVIDDLLAHASSSDAGAVTTQRLLVIKQMTKAAQP